MLTQTQARCLRFISDHISTTGISPSFGDVAEAMRWRSRSVARGVIEQLVDRGYLAKLPHHARSMTVLKSAPPGAVFLPVDMSGAIDHSRGVSLTGAAWQ